MKVESVHAKRQLLTIVNKIQILKEIKWNCFPKYIDSWVSDDYDVNYLIMSYFGALVGEIQNFHDYNLSFNIVYNLSLKMLDVKLFTNFVLFIVILNQTIFLYNKT